MPNRLSDMTGKQIWNMLWPFLLVIGVGSALRIWYPRGWWPPSDVTFALCDAIVVAGIVGLLLELAATKFLIERVAMDLSERLIGYQLPKELQRHIKSIVETEKVRDHYVKSYRFSKPEGESIAIEMEVTFDVRNYSFSPIDYTPDMDEEEAFKPKFLYLEYAIGGQAAHSLTKEQLLARVKPKYSPSTTTKLVSGDKPVRLNSIHEDHNAVCHVTWKWQVVMPVEFSDTVEFRNATIDAKLRVLELPEGLNFVSGGDLLPRDATSESWDFRGPFIGGQAIRARWFKTKPVSP